jgi:spore coat polysaccharide biosynthesis protein SpsF
MKKVIAIIQARTGSTRLPSKVLRDIAGKPILFHVIERTKRCKKVESIMVATTDREEDRVIIEFARKCAVETFAGSENDVLDRYYQVAKKFKADVIVRITADCPLINSSTIDKMIDLCLKENAEYICGHPSVSSVEQGVEVISFSALERAKNAATKDYQKEHVTIFIRENPELFKIKVIKPKPIFQRTDIRLTVDTEDDLKFMRKIYDKLYKEGEIIDLKDVIKLIDKNPRLKEINAQVEMSDINKYSASPELKRKLLNSLRIKIVFRCDASKEIGLGHLIRCLTVANKLRGQNCIVFATTKDGTNSYIRAGNFEVLLKKNNVTEEIFLDRTVSIVKPDIIVIDKKYPYRSTFIKHLKQNKTKIVMLDNICEGLSACDEIVFPNAHLDKNLLKKYLLQEQIGGVKTGPEYVILRDKILALKNKITHNIHTPPNIIVTTGGTDPEGVLIKLIPLFMEMNMKANFLILVGQAFKFKNELEYLTGNLPNNFQILSYSPQELIKGDIAVCTFGVSIYEMIYLQIPTICISHTVENAYGARILEEKYGIIENIGYFKDVNQQDLYVAITKLLKDKKYYKNMVKRCSDMIDGDGAKRVGKIITG